MRMNPPVLPENYVDKVHADELVRTLELIRQRHPDTAAVSRDRASDHQRDGGHRLQHHRRPSSNCELGTRSPALYRTGGAL